MILNHAGEPVTIGQQEAAVQAETGNAVASTEESGSTPISARNLLTGS